MTTPAETCPHCTHPWAGHAPDYDNPKAARCGECGCRWRNPADIPPPAPPTERDDLAETIANVIWGELESQSEADPFSGPCVVRGELIDGFVDMTAVAKAVAAIFVDDRDDCTSCHSPCAVSEWKTPLNGDDAE